MDDKIVRRALVNHVLEVIDTLPTDRGSDAFLTLLFMVAWVLDSEEERTLIGLMNLAWPEIQEAVRKRLLAVDPGVFN